MRQQGSTLLIGIIGLSFIACEPAGSGQESMEPAATEQAADDQAPVVQVIARDFEFDLPSSIPSGWTTFQLTNEGEQEHFMYMYRLPDGMDIATFQQEAMVPFGRVWNAYAAAEISRAEAEQAFAEEIPEWFFTELTPAGGVALTEPGETARTTLMLEPGDYVVECYVKTPQGTYHTERGMQVALEVTEESNGAASPEADVEITLTNYEIQVAGELGAGPQTIAIHAAERPEGFMPHDLNLIRIDADADVQEVIAWMDWMNLDQFRAPTPGHSMGGAEHMAAGRTAYVDVDLGPGRYLLISEGYGHMGMVHEFTVN